jgi:hypothetical protein
VLYVLAIPLGIVFLLQGPRPWQRRLGKVAVGLSLVLTVMLHVELVYPFLPMPKGLSLHRDISGWPEIMGRAASILAADKDRTALLGVPNWSLGSRALYYAEDPSRVVVVDERRDQFDLWQSADPRGRDVLLIVPWHFHIDIATRYRCRASEQAGEIEIELRHHWVDRVAFIWCRGLGGDSMQLCPVTGGSVAAGRGRREGPRHCVGAAERS